MLSRRAFLRRLDASAIERAIARVETRTTGEIRVSIARFFLGSSRRLAEHAFQRLGMRATRERNGVLLLIVPARHLVVVLGDEGIHGRMGDAFWQAIVTGVRARFREERYTEGVVEAIDAIGEALASHFPAVDGAGGNPNELPDSIDLGHS